MTPVDDDLELLTGRGTGELLQAALDTAGGRLLEWRATEVDHRPGRSTTVAYTALVVLGGEQREVSLGASTGLRAVETLPEGVIALSDGDRDAAVWLFPHDPWLPALHPALDRETLGVLLESLGAGSTSPDAVETTLVRYRPGRRAVVRVRSGGTTLFLKVLRPGEAEELHDRHTLLTEAGLPTPTSLGWNEHGLLVLAGLPGTPMRHRLRERSSLVPSGAELVTMLERWPSSAARLPRPVSWNDDVLHYARVVGAALPSEAERITEVAARVQAGLAPYDGSPDVVHGDLYEGQLLLAAGTDEGGPMLSGLLDVDTVGPGRRADDLACSLAHLVVLAQAEPGHEATTLRLAHAWWADFERVVDPVELRLRTAGVILSLSPGPHRVQEPGWEQATRDRVSAAASWLRSAERLGGVSR